jgi:TonB family protein
MAEWGMRSLLLGVVAALIVPAVLGAASRGKQISKASEQAEASERAGDLAGAVRLRAHVVDLWRGWSDLPDRVPLARSLGDLARALVKQEEYAEAEIALEEAWRILVASEGESGSPALIYRLRLAEVQVRQNKAEVAEANFKSALELAGDRVLVREEAVKAYAAFLRKLSRNKEAEALPRVARGLERVKGSVKAPRPIYHPDPKYSESARRLKISGTVVLRVVVGDTGNVTEVVVSEPLGVGLDEQAVDTVNQWKFEPATKDGKPVAVIANIEVNFRLL